MRGLIGRTVDNQWGGRAADKYIFVVITLKGDQPAWLYSSLWFIQLLRQTYNRQIVGF